MPEDCWDGAVRVAISVPAAGLAPPAPFIQRNDESGTVRVLVPGSTEELSRPVMVISASKRARLGAATLMISEIEKTFRGKIPRTLLRLTTNGRAAFAEYRKKLKQSL